MATSASQAPASNSQDQINGIQLLAQGLRRHLERQLRSDQHELPDRRDGSFGVDVGNQSVISTDAPILGV